MANTIKLSAVGLLALLAAGMFAQTATTTPVGFVKYTVPAAPSPTNPSISFIGFPMINEAVFSGTLTAVGTSTLSVAGTPWSTLPSPEFLNGPFLARIVSGTGAGHCFLITAQTANMLTVNLRGVGSLVGLVAVGDRIEVTPADTLASLFGSPTILLAGSSAANADNIQVRTATGWDTYFYLATPVPGQWRKGFSPANNDVIYPDQAIIIIRRATTPIDLISVGQVPVSAQKSLVAGPGTTAFVNRFPVPTTLSALGLHLMPGWLKGSSASNSDTVLLRTATGWDTYFCNVDNQWRKGFSPADATVIDVGAGLVINRRSTAVGSAALMTNALPY